MNNFRTILLVLATLTTFGCVESDFPVATGKGTLRSLSAAVTVSEVAFLIEERILGVVPFKETTPILEFDDLDYTIHFEYRFAGDLEPTRLVSIPFKMVKDTDYLFIFTGSLTAPDALTWESPRRIWDDAETVMEISFGHLSPQVGEIDVYFGDPGFIPVLGEARATLAYGEPSPAIELPAGDYEYIVTSKDDPADILFNSKTVSFQSRTGYLVSIFDSDPSITAPMSARIMTRAGASAELADVNYPATLRTLHSTITVGPYDFYRDLDFTDPWFTNVDFGTVTAERDAPPENATYTFTDAGNVGSVIHEEEFPVFDAHRTTRFLLGAAPILTTLLTVDDIRPIEDSTKFRIIQTVTNHTALDIYLVEAGIDINDVLPRFRSFAFLGNTGYINIIENDYEVYATLAGSKDILAGPFSFTATNGDILHLAMLDNVDPSIVTIFNYDHLSVMP